MSHEARADQSIIVTGETLVNNNSQTLDECVADWKDIFAAEGNTTPQEIFDELVAEESWAVTDDFTGDEPEVLAYFVDKLLDNNTELLKELNWLYLQVYQSAWAQADHVSGTNLEILQYADRFAAVTNQTLIHGPISLEGNVAILEWGKQSLTVIALEKEAKAPGEQQSYLSIAVNAPRDYLETIIFVNDGRIDYALAHAQHNGSSHNIVSRPPASAV